MVPALTLRLRPALPACTCCRCFWFKLQPCGCLHAPAAHKPLQRPRTTVDRSAVAGDTTSDADAGCPRRLPPRPACCSSGNDSAAPAGKRRDSRDAHRGVWRRPRLLSLPIGDDVCSWWLTCGTTAAAAAAAADLRQQRLSQSAAAPAAEAGAGPAAVPGAVRACARGDSCGSSRSAIELGGTLTGECPSWSCWHDRQQFRPGKGGGSRCWLAPNRR
jgi:hypothetical protein